ncbi:regulating synaptic membrane exocytosis protein 3 isoform X2 [Lonchura striata]
MEACKNGTQKWCQKMVTEICTQKWHLKMIPPKMAPKNDTQKMTLQLNQTEGGPKKLRSTIRRSTETGIAVEMRTRVTRQGSRESTDGSTNSNSSDGTFIFPTTRLGAESQFSDFLDGLGPGQLVGRQTLATPPMGDVHVGMADRNGQLEVDVIQARGLIPKMGSKCIPGLPAGERRLPGQEEDQGGEENLRSLVPAAPALRGESPGQSPAGDRLGRLRAHGPQVLHGDGPDHPGGAGSLQRCLGLVQTLPHLLPGRLQHRTPDPPPLPVLPGELHQPLLPVEAGIGKETSKETLQNWSWRAVNIKYPFFFFPFLFFFFFFFFFLNFQSPSPTKKNLPWTPSLGRERERGPGARQGGRRGENSLRGLRLPTIPDCSQTSSWKLPALSRPCWEQ